MAKAGLYAYRDRKARKGEFRSIWITRISAICRQHGIRYSEFMQGMRLANVQLNLDRGGEKVQKLQLLVDNVVVAGRFVGFYASEAGQGRDLNGDTDTLDRVLHLYDGDTGATRNTGLCVESLVMSERLAAFTAPEFQQGATDLNGDGDISDRVLHVFDRGKGTIQNLRLDPTFSIVTAGTLVAFRASEAAQGKADFNGDGDAQGFVLHFYDVAS